MADHAHHAHDHSHKEDYVTSALATLKQKGFRSTRPRKLVVELLDTAKEPLSAYEIKAHLDEQGEKVDTVSVYRVLSCLEEAGLIHRIMPTGKVTKCQLDHEDHCELDTPHHCHHLMICRGCGAVEEVHCPDMSQVVANLGKRTQFLIEGHNLEFNGLCPACQTS